MYVWVDALVNYLTVLGYPEQGGLEGWPCDVQVIGKDIVKYVPSPIGPTKTRHHDPFRSSIPRSKKDLGQFTDVVFRFHALHWPALLMSAGLRPPTRVMAHAHWTMGKSKMSKSKGNVVNPLEALDKWGVDGVRWYLMRVGGSLADDAGMSPSP